MVFKMWIEGLEEEETVSNGGINISTAASLCGLFDKERGQKIRDWLLENVAIHNNEEEDEYWRIFPLEKLPELLALLDGIPGDLVGRVTDKSWRLTRERAEEIMKEHIDFIDSWPNENGQMVYTLENRVVEAMAVTELVRKAIQMGRSILSE